MSANKLRDGILLAFLATAVAVPVQAGDLRVVLEAEGGVRNDGNFDQVERLDEPDPEDEGEENVARAGLNLRLSYELPRLTLALGYSPSYEWLLDNGDRTGGSGITHRLNLGLTGNLTRRLELQIRERLLSSPGLDLYSPLAAADSVAVARRGDQLTHSLDVGLTQALTRRTSLLLGATHTLRTFEDEGFSDTETLAARIGTGFELAEDSRLDLLATAGSYDFGERRQPGIPGVGGGQLEREADVQTLGVAWQQPFFRDGRFRVEAGMFAVDSTRTTLVPGPVDEEPTLVNEDFEQTGWRGALELSRQLELFGWNLGLRHDVSAGAGLGRTTAVDSAFAGVSTNLGRRFVIGLDGSFSRHDDLENDADSAVILTPEERILESAAGTARFSWGFSNLVRLNGGYSRIWQESRVAPFEDLSYSRYFLGLALQIYRTGEEPEDPVLQDQEEPEDDEPDAQ